MITVRDIPSGPDGAMETFDSHNNMVVFDLEDGSSLRCQVTPLGLEIRSLESSIIIKPSASNQIYIK